MGIGDRRSLPLALVRTQQLRHAAPCECHFGFAHRVQRTVLHRHECGELQYTPCTRSFHRTEKEYGDRKCNPCSESTCTSTLRRSRKGKVASSLDIEQIGFVSFKYYICTNLLP